MTENLASADALAVLGVDITHCFSHGWYFKVSHIKAGTRLAKHSHQYDHASFLVAGDASVIIDGSLMAGLHGPCAITIERGRKHEVIALTDIVWICAHRTDDTNPDTVDVSLMSKVEA